MIFPNKLCVTITDEDIKQGKRGVDNECPLALAIKRLHPEYEVHVMVCTHNRFGKVILYKDVFAMMYIIQDYANIRLLTYDNTGEWDLKKVVLKKCIYNYPRQSSIAQAKPRTGEITIKA